MAGMKFELATEGPVFPGNDSQDLNWQHGKVRSRSLT